jgi:hypothetical protein
MGAPAPGHRTPAVFVHIPKNAGTSMITALGVEKLNSLRDAVELYYPRTVVTFGHMSLLDLVRARLVQQKDLDAAFVFTFTRDPYTRAVSLFRYLLLHGKLRGIMSNAFIEAARDGRTEPEEAVAEFLRFLARVADGVPRIGPYNTCELSQANPQVRWMEGINFDFVGTHEAISDGFRVVSERILGAPKELPHENPSVVLRNVRPHDLLTPDARQAIRDIYHEDFVKLGYDSAAGEAR